MVNVLKLQNTFLFLFSIKMLVIRVEFLKCLSEKQTGKQSDLGVHCLYRPFWQAISVLNLRTFTLNVFSFQR